jgi:hypothetical protein
LKLLTLYTRWKSAIARRLDYSKAAAAVTEIGRYQRRLEVEVGSCRRPTPGGQGSSSLKVSLKVLALGSSDAVPQDVGPPHPAETCEIDRKDSTVYFRIGEEQARHMGLLKKALTSMDLGKNSSAYIRDQLLDLHPHQHQHQRPHQHRNQELEGS